MLLVSAVFLLGAAPAEASHQRPTPTNLGATAGDAQVTLSWRKGGAPTTHAYEVEYGEHPSGTLSSISIAGTNAQSVSRTITGLTNGTIYRFRVRSTALGAHTTSGWSGWVTATPRRTVSLSVTPNPVVEGGSAEVKVTLTSALASNVSIPVTTTRGTAEPGDVETGNLFLLVPSGETMATTTVTTARDTDTDNETFTLALGTPLPSGVTAGTPASVTVIIADNDISWAATLTAKDLTGSHGCDDGNSTAANRCEPTTGALTDDDFSLGGGTTYDVTRVTLNDTNADLDLRFDQTVSVGLKSLVLLVGDQRFALAHATLSSCDGGTNNCLAWDTGPAAWTDDQSVALSLKPPGALSAPWTLDQPSTRLRTVTEGAAVTFTVALASEPVDDVTVNLRLAGDDQDKASVAPATLEFTGGSTGTWAMAQTVTVTARQDPDSDDELPIILLLTETDDAYYKSPTVGIHVAVTDDERLADAALDGFVLSAGTLAPAFTPGTRSYTASVPNEVASVTVTPGVRSAGVSVTVDGQSVTSGQASAAIALEVGTPKAIAVVVTAGDGSWTRTYTVTVTRLSPGRRRAPWS